MTGLPPVTDETKTSVYQWARLAGAFVYGCAVLIVHARVAPFTDLALIALLSFAGALAGGDIRKLLGNGK